MDKFVGRKKELEMLNKAYASVQTEFIPLYGRRRIGKSELILHFIKDKFSLYFLGKKATPPLQIREFLDEASRVFDQPLLKNVMVKNWGDALDLVIKEKRSPQKLVLVFDEFQWTVESSPELSSLLQSLLDRDWKARKDILLIVCGSYLGFMEREVLGEKSPLFGRRTGQIQLKPFSYKEAAEFHASWSLKDKAAAYFICGGVPYYHLFFSEKRSIQKNIELNFFDELSPLYKEPDFLLKEELRELEKYYTLLMSFSNSSQTNKEMSQKTGIDERKIYYYVQNLIELGYVSKIFPLHPQEVSLKNVKFVLYDPLLKFWFRFVYPHSAYIAQVSPHEAYQNIVKPNLESYFGKCFECLCREALAGLYIKEGLSNRFEIGEYWNKKVQIDLVGYRKDEGIDIGECKWGKIKSRQNMVKELQNKMKQYPECGLTLRGLLFTEHKLKKSDEKDLLFYNLEDLYA